METGFLNQHDNEYFSSEIYDRSNDFESESSVFNNVISDFELGSSDDWRYTGQNLQGDSDDFEKSLNNWRKHISSLKTQDSGIDLMYDSVTKVPDFNIEENEENEKKFNIDDLCSSANFESHDLGPDNYDVVEIAVEKDDFFVKKEDLFQDDLPTKEESDHIYFSPIKSVPEKTEKVDDEILPEIFKNIKGKLKNESVRLDHDYCTSDSFPVRIKTENWPSPKKDSGLESGEVSDASETAQDKQVKPGESLLRANHIKVENTDSQETSCQFPPQIHIKEDGTVINQDGAVVSKKRKLNLDEYRSRRKNMKVKTEPVEIVKVEKPPVEPDTERVMVNAQVQTADEKKEVKRRRYRSSSSSSSSSSSRSRKYRRRSRSRSRTRSRRSRDDHRRRRYSPPKYSLSEKRKQCEERRVVYVGQIEEGTTKSQLRERFQRFGPIVDISLHFRERGDNYGFVTFMYKVDAYEAVEHGNDNPAEQKFDICFGGRRAFCQQRYADLDGSMHYGQYSNQRTDDSFDAILREAQESLRKKQKYV